MIGSAGLLFDSAFWNTAPQVLKKFIFSSFLLFRMTMLKTEDQNITPDLSEHTQELLQAALFLQMDSAAKKTLFAKVLVPANTPLKQIAELNKIIFSKMKQSGQVADRQFQKSELNYKVRFSTSDLWHN